MKSTKSHGPGRGMVQINTTIPDAADAELRRQATANAETRSAYARRLLLRGLRDPITVIEHSASEQRIYPIDQPENPTARAAEPPPA